MDPISLGLGIAGLGMSLFGGLSGASVAKQQASVSENIATQEQNINQQKQQQAQLESQRMQTENFRNTQRARAQGLNSAVNQGAQFGSGLSGGQAQATDQGLFNSLGINQNMQLSNSIYADTSTINSDKIQLASLGGQAATDQGIASLGGALTKAGPIIGAFGKNATNGTGSFGGLFGGGSPSGYGTG